MEEGITTSEQLPNDGAGSRAHTVMERARVSHMVHMEQAVAVKNAFRKLGITICCRIRDNSCTKLDVLSGR